MELRQNLRHATTRPMAWVATLVIALALALVGWYVIGSSAPRSQAGVATPQATSIESPRIGGPGGQVGDPDQAPRVGGPGGQIGDAP
jgi:hypothetical protein